MTSSGTKRASISAAAGELLVRLGSEAVPGRQAVSQWISPSLQRLFDRLAGNPMAVYDARWNLVVTNQAYDAISGVLAWTGIERTGTRRNGGAASVNTMTTYALGTITVHRVGYGAMQLPGPGVFGPPRDHEEAVAVLRRAVELGVDHIDTAQYYGPDVSNQLIRAALYPYPENLALVSKVGAVRDDTGGWLPAQRPEQLRSGVEANLAALGIERLAAVNLRLMGREAHGVQLPSDQVVAFEDQLGEMVALRDEGKIAGIGISTVDRAQVEQAISQAGIVCVQNAFSLLDQSDSDVLDLCQRAGIAYVPFFPLGSAIPGLPKVTDNPAVRAVAARVGATPAQVGLAWLLAHRDNVLLIPGTSTVTHLEQNMAVADVSLSRDDLAELDRAA